MIEQRFTLICFYDDEFCTHEMNMICLPIHCLGSYKRISIDFILLVILVHLTYAQSRIYSSIEWINLNWTGEIMIFLIFSIYFILYLTKLNKSYRQNTWMRKSNVAKYLFWPLILHMFHRIIKWIQIKYFMLMLFKRQYLSSLLFTQDTILKRKKPIT